MTVTILHGDCSEILPTLDANSIDACVTDPPAGISFMNRSWDHNRGGRQQWVSWLTDVMREVHRVLKPGAHAVVWSLPRTSHWTGCALEDAGFEVRDVITHLFGSGFPKSNNGLKPAAQFWWLCRKPIIDTVANNVLTHGTGALNIDACRIATSEQWSRPIPDKPAPKFGTRCYASDKWSMEEAAKDANTNGPTLGRWPANVTHDGSDEVLAEFAKYGERTSGQLHPWHNVRQNDSGWSGGSYANRVRTSFRGDTGSAARFFYSAKATSGDRLSSKHPTVKPVSLLQWLVKLITPPGGTVLDPFAGSGTTGMACLAESFDAILIEREAEYVKDIRNRLKHVKGEDTPLFAEHPEQATLL